MNPVHLELLKQLIGIKTILTYDGLHQLMMADLQSLGILLKRRKKEPIDGLKPVRLVLIVKEQRVIWMKVKSINSEYVLLMQLDRVNQAMLARVLRQNQGNVSRRSSSKALPNA